MSGINVAIVDDIKRDRPTKNVLAQTNTKTVGPPSTDTGLTGDLLPDEVFSVDDFDLIKNQVNLEERNFQLLEALNTIGQITNMQSQSGPILNTGRVVAVTDTTGSGSPVVTILEPNVGEAYEITAAEWQIKNANAMFFRIQEGNTGESVLVEYKTAVGTLDVTTVPIRVVYPQRAVVTFGTSTGTNTFKCAYHRIR